MSTSGSASRRARPGLPLSVRYAVSVAVVVAVAVVTSAAVAALVGPGVFHMHLVRVEGADAGMVFHAEQAFRAATAIALAAGLTASLAAGAVAAWLVGRAFTRSLRPFTRAFARLARGDYAVRVPERGPGREVGAVAAAVNRMADDLEHVEQARRRVLVDLAHEMRTPLATLRGYVEGIEDGVERADPATLDLMRRQIGRLTRLSQDIAEVTRAEEGRLALRPRPLDLRDAVRTAAVGAHRAFEQAGVTLDVRADQDLPVAADPDRVGQILTNLLDNARRYTPRGGHVRLAAERLGDEVQVAVADDGAGIAPQHLPHVFERFYRAEPDRVRRGGGSGIGLAVVRALVQAHGGRVWASSAGAGLGTTVRFALPLAR